MCYCGSIATGNFMRAVRFGYVDRSEISPAIRLHPPYLFLGMKASLDECVWPLPDHDTGLTIYETPEQLDRPALREWRVFLWSRSSEDADVSGRTCGFCRVDTRASIKGIMRIILLWRYSEMTG